MLNIFLILMIIIIIIIIFTIINNNLIEKFSNIIAPHPDPTHSSWSYGTETGGSENSISSPGSTCVIKNPDNTNSFGIYDSNHNCIPLVSKSSSSTNQTGASTQSSSTSTSPPSAPTTTSPSLDGCIPNTQDFEKYCKSLNSSYGVKSVTICDSNNSKVECAPNYINGVQYDNNDIITPCLDRNTDFSVWCKYYNSKPIPSGFNVNSIGVSKILVGSEGGCFVNNNVADKNKARAICNYQNMDSVKKLERANNNLNYNVFTTCMPEDSNFVSQCSNLLDKKEYEKNENKITVAANLGSPINNISSDDCKLRCNENNDCYGYLYKKDNGSCFLKGKDVTTANKYNDNNYDLYINNKDTNSRAIEIMGYDCNPGFARAKCINKQDIIYFDNGNLFNSVFNTGNLSNYSQCGNKCNN